MNIKNSTPEAQGKTTGVTHQITYKGTKFSLSKLQFAFFITLSNGKKHSSHQLMQQLHTSDPRKEVQYLRDRGIIVEDMWIPRYGEIPRHKLYWINPIDAM